ncbi:MAG: prepilin-type N-terminal cleavage/methylation domain-containing protein [Candidatus Omnitrophica bacterium]|nr:prepilin-type N-terminal cleavage/methylation domain-containing protein [Candidatus Omnitrophota bacterium]
MNKRKAFSLIELIVVLGIIAVIIAFSTAYFFNFKSSAALTIAAQEIVATFNQARSLAITNLKNYKVFFDVANSTYVVREDLTNNAIDIVHRLKDGIVIDHTTFSSDEVIFQPTGNLSGGKGSVFIRDSAGKFNTLVIENTTGRIKVLNYQELP